MDDRAPILDFDADPADFISSAQPPRDSLGSDTAVLAILGEKVATRARSQHAELVATIDMVTETYDVWRFSRGERSVLVVACPIGAPAAVILMENLIGYQVRSFIAVGAAGSLDASAEGEFFVPRRALRDEGTSYHYAPAAMWIDTDPDVSAACTAAITKAGLAARDVTTWTTDGFYRETPAIIDARRDQGCEVVEMECAAFASCATFRGARFGHILFTADSLAGDAYQFRRFGVDSHDAALTLALDAAFEVCSG